MVSTTILYIELLCDIVGLIGGSIVFIRSSDNNLHRAWGALAISLSLLLLYDNVEWMYLFCKTTGNLPDFVEVPMDHLSLWHTVRTVVFFQLFSLFPIASLKPGWMTLTRITNMLIPVIIITCIACCYELFNGHYTSLKSFNDIINNLDKQDVILRLVLFIASVIIPSCNFLFPYFRHWTPIRRKQSRAMGIYMICFSMIMSGYIWLMLGTTGLCFNLFGLIVILPTICLNILHIRYENPLSIPPLPVETLNTAEIEAIKEIEVSPVILELSNHLQAYMKENTPFTNPQYTLKDLLVDFNTTESKLNKVLHYNGFSGFRDYINFNRLQYFKKLATTHTYLSIKELMFRSGFSSRSSFYRYFASIEKISPSEYMDNLKDEIKAPAGKSQTN